MAWVPVLLVVTCSLLGPGWASPMSDLDRSDVWMEDMLDGNNLDVTVTKSSGIDIDSVTGTWMTYYGPYGLYEKTFIQLSKTTPRQVAAYHQSLTKSDIQPMIGIDWDRVSLYGKSKGIIFLEFLVEIMQERSIRIIPINSESTMENYIFNVKFSYENMFLTNCSSRLEIGLFRVESEDEEVSPCRAIEKKHVDSRSFLGGIPEDKLEIARKEFGYKRIETTDVTPESEDDWYKLSLHISKRINGTTYKTNITSEAFGKSATIQPVLSQTSRDLLGIFFRSDKSETSINISAIREDLYNNITNARYDNAVTISKMLEGSKNGPIIADIVKTLISCSVRNTMGYAYKLWNDDAKEIVNKYFPESFKLILNEDDVRIINKKHNLPLKLDSSTDYYHDRLVWGDSGQAGCALDSFKWKVIPIWSGNEIFFKIMNLRYDMYIKLDVNHDRIGDRRAWGDKKSEENRFRWYLEPVKMNNAIVFCFINREYNQGLKLQWQVDDIGDRKLWGHNGDVYDDIERFSWYIKPWI